MFASIFPAVSRFWKFMSSKDTTKSYLKIYNRYIGANDEQQKKKVKGYLRLGFLRNFVKRDHSFFQMFKKRPLKKILCYPKLH